LKSFGTRANLMPSIMINNASARNTLVMMFAYMVRDAKYVMF